MLTFAAASGAEAPPAPPLVCQAPTPATINGTTGPVGDNATTTFTAVVSGQPTLLWDVDVALSLAHAFPADLDVTLTSPEGTTVILSTDNGAGNDDVFNGTLFDDQANPGGQVPYNTNEGLATDHPYQNNQVATPLAPESALGALLGENPNGTWTLSVADDDPTVAGTLSAFSLTIVALDDDIVPTAATFQSALPGPAITIPNSVFSGSSTISVTGLTDPLCNVDVITNLTHTFAGDLDITVMSPAGTIVTLTTDNGAGNDNVFNGTRWDDAAAESVSDTTYMNAVPKTALAPEEALSAFTGEQGNGTWTITISDDAGGDVGELSSWQLNLETCRAADQDADGVSDSCDNCPAVANAGQQDVDNDDEGNACDCGDGLPAAGEECDDGNNDDGDGCDSTCNDEAPTGTGGEGGGGGEGGEPGSGGTAGTATGGTSGNATGGTGGRVTGNAGEGGESSGGEPGSGGTAGSAGGVAVTGGSAGSAGTSTTGGSSGSGGSGGAATGGSAGSGGANGGTGGRRPAASKDEGGCGCRVPTGRSSQSSTMFFTGVAVALAVLRRRKRG